VLPAECKGGPESVRSALASAPGRVELGGTTISDCLKQASGGADVQTIGSSLIAAAQDLADEARSDPEGPAATRLGYLAGAARRGAAKVQGFHEETLRRLEQELQAVDTRSDAFRRGERAGRRDG